MEAIEAPMIIDAVSISMTLRVPRQEALYQTGPAPLILPATPGSA